jgi:hypothetical protein
MPGGEWYQLFRHDAAKFGIPPSTFDSKIKQPQKAWCHNL